jgi:hypothetical protein
VRCAEPSTLKCARCTPLAISQDFGVPWLLRWNARDLTRHSADLTPLEPIAATAQSKL